MVILCDTRQQAGKHENIDRYFARHGIKTARQALYVGDYTIANDARRAVDTKQDVMELVHDIMSEDHERFRRECVRAQEAGIELLVLIEEVLPKGGLNAWTAPKDRTGRPLTKVRGESLRIAMLTMMMKYDVVFRFCAAKDTGKIVHEYLAEGVVPRAKG